MKTALLAIIGSFTFSLFLQAESSPKKTETQERLKPPSGLDVTWQKTAEDRTQARTKVQELLRKPLTVTSAIQIALLNNRGLQATYEEIGIAQADVMEATTIPNPKVDFSALIPNVAGDAVKYSWNIAQDFVQLLMIPLKGKLAREQFEITELRVAAQSLQVIEEIKKAYYQVQAEQQLLTRLALIQDTNKVTLDLSQKQYEAGNITDLRLLMVQAAYSQGRLDLAQAEASLRADRETLNQLLGLWGSEIQWTISGDLPPPPATDPSMKNLESMAVAQRLDLQAAHRNLSGVVSALGLTKTYRWVPVLDLGFAGERETDNALLLGPSIAFELPIFNQGQSRVAKGESELRRAENQFESLAVGIRSDVRMLRDKLIAARESARFYHDELLPTRIKIVNKAILEYNAMQLGAYELFSIKAEELEAERGYIQALRTYWTTRASLERAVGGSLTPVPKKTTPTETKTPAPSPRPTTKSVPQRSKS